MYHFSLSELYLILGLETKKLHPIDFSWDFGLFVFSFPFHPLNFPG